MNHTLVIIPTYNESANILSVIHSALKHDGIDILVIDDGSPDGTAGLVREVTAKNGRVSLLERGEKLGLGTAYIAGFQWGLERGYKYFIEMDADGSHDTAILNAFVREMEKGSDLVIGSRYLKGTISVVGWDFRRLMISKFGNFYASRVLGVKLTDMTSGYRCYSRRALESINLEGIHSNGYAFQIEMAYRIVTAGLSVSEMSITFYEREYGYSKMSKKIIGEAIFIPWRLKFGRILDAAGRALGGQTR
jgi:dolichol-phosphate mannosyltransferase